MSFSLQYVSDIHLEFRNESFDNLINPVSKKYCFMW